MKRNIKKPYPSSSQYGSGEETENWVETVSMVAMKELSDKSSAKLEYKREEKNRATVYITADFKQLIMIIHILQNLQVKKYIT